MREAVHTASQLLPERACVLFAQNSKYAHKRVKWKVDTIVQGAVCARVVRRVCMIYLSQLLKTPVFDAKGDKIGRVNDLGIATGEVFPRITALAVEGPGKTPFMISWKKYVDSFSEDEIRLKVVDTDIRFSYLQPNEVLIARDLLNKQIVDTRGMRIVRVNDLKLSDTSSSQLRLLGAEVGIRGILRSISIHLEHLVMRYAKALGKPLPEKIIAWNYMDLLDRDLSAVKLSVSHKTLDGLHPADIADILERLDPRLRGQVFAQLDDERAADAMAEFDDDAMAAEIMGEMSEGQASRMLSEMDPDDAAELVSELDYDKAEKILHLMGVKERKAIRQLLGYREDTAGRIMTSEVVCLPETSTKDDCVSCLKSLDEDFEAVHYVYLKDEEGRLSGVVNLQKLITADGTRVLKDIATTDLVWANPDDDQEDVVENIAKYNLLAMPVVDDMRRLLGIVTVDDALDVMEEEHEEDLQIAGAGSGDADSKSNSSALLWLFRHHIWLIFWIIGMGILFLAGGMYTGLSREISREKAVLMFSGAALLPVLFVLADASISYVTNFFLENDANDESSPSDLGFLIKSIALAIVVALFFCALGYASTLLLSTSSALQTLARPVSHIFLALGVSITISFLIAPIYLKVLRIRDEKNLDTSGFLLSCIAMLIAFGVYTLCICLFFA